MSSDSDNINSDGTITIFGRTLYQDPFNYLSQVDNNTVYVTPRFNTTGLIELKIGVLLPFSQKDDKFTEDIVWGGASAIRMAVNEINAAQVIPGAYITLIEKDSYPDASLGQAAVTNAVYALVTLLQQGVIGVIGDVTSSWTALSALMTSALELPQCSFTASSVSFSDKGQFKYFFRTIPTDVVMIDAMLRFVVYQGWTKIGVIYSDDSLGQQLYQRVIQQTEVMNIQLINYQSFPSTTSTPTSDEMKTSLDSLSNNGARVILLAATGQIQSDLLVQAAVAGYLSSEYTWLLVDDDATSYLQETIDTYNNNTHSTNNTRQLSLKSDFNGLIYFTNWLTLNGYPPYDKFLSSWSHLDSNVYPYAGTTQINTNEGLAYSCLMMMANGFQNILRPSTNHTDGLLQLASGNLGDFLTPQAFNTGYVGPDGPMQLDANGDMMAGNYRIMNYQHGNPIAIGQVLVGNLTMFSSPMFFDGTYHVPSDSPPSSALNPDVTFAISFVIMIVAAIGSLFAVSVFIIVVIFRKNEIFKAASPLFCCLELIGFIFTYASVVMMIGPPSQTTCIAMPISFSLGLLLVLSNMIAKNYRIYRIFNNIFISRTVITDLQLIKSVTVMMGIDLIILVIGLIVVTPYPEKVSVSLTQYYWSCNVEHPSKLVFAGLLCSYNGILLIFATFLAYKTRLAGKHYSRYSECRQMGLSIYNILFSAIVGFVVLVNPMADYYTKYYISVVTVLWATTFSLLILFLPKLQAFIQQRRQEKDKENEKLSVASHLIAAAAATVGFGTTGEGHTTTTTTTTHHHQKQQQQALLSTNHLQKKQHSFYHMGSKENDHNAMELLSLEEILGSNAPALFRRSIHNNKYDSSISNNNNNHEGYIENIGRNHGSYVEVYEADVPARKVLRYLPSLSQWEMLHIMVFPWLGYFSYISKNAKQGRVMTYHHASVYTAELENYVLKIHGQGMYDMYIQVPDLKTLELWEKRLNQRHQEQQGNLSFLATPPAASSAASSVRRPLRSNTIEPEDLSEDNQPSFFRRSSTSFDETTGDRHMVEPINRDQHRISLDSSPTYSGSSTMIPYSINRSNNSSNDSNHIH